MRPAAPDEKRLTLFAFWAGLLLLIAYLAPLFGDGPLYTIAFDNLDSTVVWNRLLAESGQIFAPNSATIAPMMNGLPRLSYGSELHLLFWLYYFFDPETAYRINAAAVHLSAYLSLWLFLSRYFLPKHPLRPLVIAAASLYFATLPFHYGAGISTSVLPLYAYIYLNIHTRRDRITDWLLLLVLPFYCDLVFLHIFVLAFALGGWALLSLQERRIDWRLLGAIALTGALFVLIEYRLFANLLDPLFLSHRTEFDVYFNLPYLQSYFFAHQFLFSGWRQHQPTLVMPYILPFVLIASLFSLSPRRFGPRESLLLWSLALLSFFVPFWPKFQDEGNILIYLSVWSLVLYFRGGESKPIGLLLLAQILLSVYMGMCQYEGGAFLKKLFPIFGSFNISRASFVSPFLWALLLAYALYVTARKSRYAPLAWIVLILAQWNYALHRRSFSARPTPIHFSISQYYMPETFRKIKHDYPEILRSRVVHYGIEPAVSLYNGLQTVDGYSTNYPLAYKHAFGSAQQECFAKAPANDRSYHRWGSKAYLLCANSQPELQHFYRPRTRFVPFLADTRKLCDLNASFLLSAYPVQNAAYRRLELLREYDGPIWNVWLYRLRCDTAGGTKEISHP
jgi:hypothetical protein